MKTYFRTFMLFALAAIPSLFAEAAAEGPPVRDQGFMQTLIMISIALVFFYFILWRPEQKRRKMMDDQRNALKQGDRVTAMGIIGTVLRVQEETIILKMYDGAKIEILKGAITDVHPGNEEDAKKAAKANGKDKRVELAPNK